MTMGLSQTGAHQDYERYLTFSGYAEDDTEYDTEYDFSRLNTTASHYV